MSTQNTIPLVLKRDAAIAANLIMVKTPGTNRHQRANFSCMEIVHSAQSRSTFQVRVEYETGAKLVLTYLEVTNKKEGHYYHLTTASIDFRNSRGRENRLFDANDLNQVPNLERKSH